MLHFFSLLFLYYIQSFLRSNFRDNTGQSFSSESTSASASAQSSAIASPDVEVMTRTSADASSENHDTNSLATSSLLRPRDVNCNDSCLWSTTAPTEECSRNDYNNQSQHISDLEKGDLTEVLKNILLIVEDISESYPEVNEISDILEEIEQLLKVSI